MAGFSNNFLTMDEQGVALAAAQTDNLQVTSSIMVVTPQNDMDAITGAYPPVYNEGILFLVNVDPVKHVVLPYNHAGSDAGFRWLNILGHDITVGPGETAQYAFVPTVGWEFLKPAILT